MWPAQDKPIRVAKGSCIDKELRFLNSDRTAQDITDVIFSIVEPFRPVLMGIVITKTDPANGKAIMHVPHEVVDELATGNVNHFRISRTYPDGCVKNTPQIWINVI